MNLTNSQQQYVRANHRRQAISEMARNLKAESSDIIDFMNDAKLAITRPCNNNMTKIIKSPSRKGYFSGFEKYF